ncbi:site-specific integrase [Yersinia enterocolitica]|nr:site-specific integrase [Yersinia enterocolitica]EKN3831196.1 site-specific integrase [Yersinia enterocolitica]
MQKSFRFTNATIKTLPINTDTRSTELEVSDNEVIGLKCLSGRTGNKRFLLRYTFHGTKKSIGIGRFPEVDVGTARQIARRHKEAIALGHDPKAERDNYRAEPTLSEFFHQTYLPYTKRHKKSWDKDVQRYTDYIEPRLGKLRYRELRARDIQQVLFDMLEGRIQGTFYAPATCNRTLAVLKTMGRYALRQDVLETNEADKVPLLRENNQRTRFFDAEEIRHILDAAREYPNKAAGGLIAMLLLTGTRKSEMLNVRHEHIDRANRTIFIPYTKNGRSRTVYLSDTALEIIDGIPRAGSNPYLFAIKDNGRPIAEPRWAYEKILTQCGIDKREVCFHTTRHSVASLLVSSGQYSLYDVKAQLAHASVQSTERYAKLTPERMRQTGQGVTDLLFNPQSVKK